MASNPPPSPTSDTGGHLGAALVIIYAIGSDKKTASFLGELFCKSSKPWQFLGNFWQIILIVGGYLLSFRRWLSLRSNCQGARKIWA